MQCNTNWPIYATFFSSLFRSDLQYRLKNHGYPFLGLEYITEYVNPGNPNKDQMYTCSLDGCKSAWGTAKEIFNHLTSNKNKHNR